MPPFYWNSALHHSAQFYANFMKYANCMSHDQACTLKESIVTDYPTKCDGNPECACSTELGTCSSVPNHTVGRARLKLFHPDYSTAEQLNRAESNGWYSSGGKCYSRFRDINDNPFKGGIFPLFHQFIFEKASLDKYNNPTYGGHRCGILGGSLCGTDQHNSIGVGYSIEHYKNTTKTSCASDFLANSIAQYSAVQTFKGNISKQYPLNSGSHYKLVSKKEKNIVNGGYVPGGTIANLNEKYESTFPEIDALYFKTHYYSDVAAKKVYLSLDGTCTELSLTVGTNKHGVYGIDKLADPPAECTPYFFEAKDANGTISRYPEKGSLIFTLDTTDGTCKKSWQPSAKGSCFASELNCTDSQHINAAGDGCEDDFATACGAHNNDCTKLAGWSKGSCKSGSCSATACKTGYYLDGTECKENTLDNCGKKGTKCANTIEGWASGSCTDGKCKVESCTTGLKVENNYCVDEKVVCGDNQHINGKSCEDDNILNCGAHNHKCAEEISDWADGKCENHVCIVTQCLNDKVISDNKCIDNTDSGDDPDHQDDNQGNQDNNQGNQDDNQGNQDDNQGNQNDNQGNQDDSPDSEITGVDDNVLMPLSDDCSGNPVSHHTSMPWLLLLGLGGAGLIRRRKMPNH